MGKRGKPADGGQGAQKSKALDAKQFATPDEVIEAIATAKTARRRLI